MSKVYLNLQYACNTFTYKLAKSGGNRRISAVNSKPTGSLVNGTQLSVERQICCDDNCYFASNFRSERTCATDALPKKTKVLRVFCTTQTNKPKIKSQSASRSVFCAGPVSSAGPKMILDSKLPRVRQVKSSKWHMVHRNVLSSSRLSGRRRCGKRSVTCYHFFKHSRGFLWFMLCNWLLTANNALSEAQLLINVQNQVRIALEFPHFPCISICTLKCNVCECQNGLLSVANRAHYSNINFEFEIQRERETETESAYEHLLLCISCDVDLYLLLFARLSIPSNCC